MNYSLPKHIINSLLTNKTSLGEHPSFPPDEEEKFLVYLLDDYYNDISNNIEVNDEELIKKELQRLISQCKKIESSNVEALENLCINVLNKIFEIPEETIEINAKLVQSVDTSKQRVVPEKTTNYTFDDIADMDYLTQEIYKRRMLNALVVGASMFYANNIDFYVQDLFKINPELPSLYKKILDLNSKLLYLQKDSLTNNKNTDGGKVDVTISSYDSKVTVNAEGIIFPILIEETIKGILEVAIAHGLPQDRKKALYVTKKSDFKLAEVWDMRLGVPLWLNIVSLFDEIDIDIFDNGMINFFLFELSQMKCKEFNNFLQNVFRHTNKGKQDLENLALNIIHDKELDDFNDFMSQKISKYNSLNDNEEYFTQDELLDDEYFSADELIADSIEY